MAGHRRLAVEFALFYGAAPVALAVLLPPSAMFPALFAVTVLGLGLLHITPGFHWGDLVHGFRRTGIGYLALFALATALAGYIAVQATMPEAFLRLPRTQPELMLAIALLYPALSALPQEIVFRPLFFRRYDAILPRSATARIGLNAAAFSFAHLMYWNWIVAAMTFAGGLVFAFSYLVRRNFPEAVIAHSVAGIILFALGLGVFFYSGNVDRPF